MALPIKSRNNRRPSSTSYTSTLTTLVFIALCVLGVWMLSSNSVVTPKTRTAIDNSATNIDFSTNEDQSETATTTTTTNNADDSTETTNNNSDDSASETTTTTTNNNSDDSTETETKTKVSEESSPETESNTKSQEQKDAPVFGDNPGSLPDDAIKNDQPKQEHQKQQPKVFEKDVQSTQVSEENSVAQDENLNAKVEEQNTESNNNNNANAGENENQEQSTGGQQDVQTFESKNNEDGVMNEQQLKEDKSEMTREKEQKPKEQVESEETVGGPREQHHKKPKKAEKNRRKSSKKESKKAWSTQADESRGEKERQKSESGEEVQKSESGGEELKWSLCNVTAGADYIPCLDNEKYLKHSHRKHYEHRERHCPEDAPTCLVPLPNGYKTRVQWPNSRDKIWYHNVPHTKLAEVKGHQNWVKLMGEFLTFPGGGTQFIHGALHYIDFLQKAEPGIAWGKHTRVILDVGCGVGSLGGYLFERDVIAMSFAPKDEHEAQVQFALERGIPAISAVMGTQRLQFPSDVFDLVHCARCRVPWHEDGGLLLLELNRVLRPGGYFVWSATPVYQTLEEDVEIWKHMTTLTKAMCWDLVTIKNDTLNQVGAAFYRKPITNECYQQREKNEPPMCKDDDDPNAAWYVPLQACLHKLPGEKAERGAKWPEAWPDRLEKAPYWLDNTKGGKPSSQEFTADTERFKNVVDELSNLGVSWSNVRNIMDMRAIYGGFAAALKDLPVWVFNVVNVDAGDTLPIIFERGLIGIYHDWCESFSTYPRTYDLLHADHLFSTLNNRCKLVPVIAEIDRILRPEGHLIVRDEPKVIEEVENLLKSMHWDITSQTQEGLICAKKSNWRPDSYVNLY